MTIARIIGLGLGLIVLVGVGAATFSMGQPPTRAVGLEPLAGDDRDRLEAEVELLQLEHEVAKADLQDFLKKFNRLELLRGVVSMTPTALFHEFADAFFEKGTDDLAQASGMMSGLAGRMQLTDIQSQLSREMEKVFLALHRARNERRREFVERTEELNKKKRELSGAQPKTQRGAR